MTWSYSGNPSYSDLNHVRFLITDTDTEEKLLQDEEISFALSVEGKVSGAAALCCEVLSRNFAKKADKSIGPIRIVNSNRAVQFDKMAKAMRDKLTMTAIPYSGGLSYIERATDEADADLIKPAFGIGMMSNN